MAPGGDVRIERLSRFIFTAPSWPQSLLLILILGFLIDMALIRAQEPIWFFGTIAFTLPALLAFLFTRFTIRIQGKELAWNRSGLLALASVVIGIITTAFAAIGVDSGFYLPITYATGLGMILSLRMPVLVAVADYRLRRMIIPAALQSLFGLGAGYYYFGGEFVLWASGLLIIFGIGSSIFIWLIDRPMKQAFGLSGLSFLNAFIAHMTDGSKTLEDFFCEIGEDVTVPQVSLFFSREGAGDAVLTIPNVHPGPMGEIGSANLPKIIHDRFDEEIFVAHGCATHDFNLVSESEADTIIEALKNSWKNLSFSRRASRPVRTRYGSVEILTQRFSDSILMISTRSPEKTEDIDFNIGMMIMAEGHRWFRDVAFIDAHNCMTEVSSPVLPATPLGTEYYRAALAAMEKALTEPLLPFSVGICHRRLPFTRTEGFGDLGIQVLAMNVDDIKSALILFDGNNIHEGVREEIRDAMSDLVDESEIMTTDTHVVNTVSGKNPIGHIIPVSSIIPHVRSAVLEALDDMKPAKSASVTTWCEGLIIFGSHRIAQFAGTVNAMLIFIPPLSLGILILAFILSILMFSVIGLYW
jgi:putative membrane protein